MRCNGDADGQKTESVASSRPQARPRLCFSTRNAWLDALPLDSTAATDAAGELPGRAAAAAACGRWLVAGGAVMLTAVANVLYDKVRPSVGSGSYHITCTCVYLFNP